MRLFNYLNENTEKYNEMIKQIIDTKCQPFMKEWDGKRLLYRGMTSKYYPYGIKQVRNDRRVVQNMDKYLYTILLTKLEVGTLNSYHQNRRNHLLSRRNQHLDFYHEGHTGFREVLSND
jgi:hypothetical protein